MTVHTPAISEQPHPHAAWRWRGMRQGDLEQVNALAAAVHPDYPEDPEVFVERLALYPDGCLVLADAADERILAYAVGHPWRHAGPPKLNSLLGALPAAPDTFYIHDVAVSPRARRGGWAGQLVSLMLAQALRDGLPRVTLVAVGNAAGYWTRHGFTVDAPGVDLSGYGTGAVRMSRLLSRTDDGSRRAQTVSSGPDLL